MKKPRMSPYAKIMLSAVVIASLASGIVQTSSSVLPEGRTHIVPIPAEPVPLVPRKEIQAQKPKSRKLTDSEIRDRIVMLVISNGGRSKAQCTGEQIIAPSGKAYILSAAHCVRNAISDKIIAMTEDGEKFNVAVIDVNPSKDLLLLEAIPGLGSMKIASKVTEYEPVRCFGHGEGHDTFQSAGEVLEIGTHPDMPGVYQIVTAGLFHGMSGGPAVNSKGEVIGINDAIDGSGFGYLVPLFDIVNFLQNR